MVSSDLLKKVLQGPKRVRRLIMWAVELNEFDIVYAPKKAIKPQVVAKVLSNFAKFDIKELELEIQGEVYSVCRKEEV